MSFKSPTSQAAEGVKVSPLNRQNLRLAMQILPKVPLMLKTTLFHFLHLSEQSAYWDLRQELTISVIRAFLTPSPSSLASISATQRLLAHDPGPQGRIWVSNWVAPADEGVRLAVAAALEGLRPKNGEGKEGMIPVIEEGWVPRAVEVEAEWTGYRKGVDKDTRMPRELGERGRYDELMKEVTGPTTVLYFHGGAYWLMDPATHRPVTKKLAKLTGGRVYSVRYRLSPQHAFPAALIDGLTSYLALLYPPEDAFHTPVSSEHVVFAGDSAGGNLSLSLLQTLLYLHRNNLSVRWLGIDRQVPLPGGVAVNSPWVDITHSSPSCAANGRFDYLPAPLHENENVDSLRPACDAWPASPARRSVFVDDHLCGHPLVTLLLAESWRGSPPVYICTGWELLADEDRYMATRLRRDGVTVVFEEYQAMPHCFAMLFPESKGARRCMEGWAGFIKKVVEEGDGGGGEAGEKKKGLAVESAFRSFKAKTLEEVDLEAAEGGWEKIAPYTEEEIVRLVEGRLRRDREEGTGQVIAKL